MIAETGPVTERLHLLGIGWCPRSCRQLTSTTGSPPIGRCHRRSRCRPARGGGGLYGQPGPRAVRAGGSLDEQAW